MVLIQLLLIPLSIIFTILGLIHFYWALGGKWGFDEALPKNKEGIRILNPRKIDSAIVGLGLCLFGVFYLLQTVWINFNLPNWLFQSVNWIIPAIFIFRAIGDFKYAGYFKKITNTTFAKFDTRLYTPLCLFIGIFGVIVALIS